MRALFAPAVAVMNRMSYVWKFLLVGVLGMLAVAVLLGTYLYHAYQEIATTRAALAGLTRVAALHKVIQVSQQHRGLSSGVLNGDASLAEKRAAKATRLDEAMAALRRELAAADRQDAAWRRIETDWASIRQDGLAWDPPTNLKKHGAMIRAEIDFLMTLGESSGLLLDTEPASFHIAQVALRALPETLEPLGQMRAKGTGVLARQAIGDQDRTQLGALLGVVEHGMHAVQLSLAPVLRHSPDLQASVGASHAEFKQAVAALDETARGILAGDLSLAPPAYFDMATRTMDTGYAQLYDILLPSAGKLLRARLANLTRDLWLYLLGIAVLLGITGYFTLGAFLSLQASVKKFAVEAACLAQGDLACRVNLDARDELGVVAASFNSVADSFARLTRNVQDGARRLAESAQAVKAASDEVRNSTRSQSDAATSMAASVQQLTQGIDSISHNAQEADTASREAGTLSSEGARVVAALVDDIRDISRSVNESASSIQELGRQSEKITAIVGVIKEIADQTNLLALNAAIEAARAGESGRGFAVVADEVRKLAERTSASTQEIDGMVQAIQHGVRVAVTSMQQGVARVNDGVVQAREAGESMTRIRAGTDHVLERVGEISSALREQAAAAGDIARNVEGIAEMAGGNSRQAGRSADTAGELLDLAGALRQEVSRYKT
jgi:methyl-accepting chemotaxis protein